MKAVTAEVPHQAPGLSGMEVLLLEFPERLPVTEATFARMAKHTRYFYLHRLEEEGMVLTELAARCIANQRTGRSKVRKKRVERSGRKRWEYRVVPGVEANGLVSMTVRLVRESVQTSA